MGVILIDYLTTVEWTSFELLGNALKLHPALLSRALRFLEAVGTRVQLAQLKLVQLA